MTARVRNEDGWVVVTATTLLAIMLVTGLALLAGVDTGQMRSREQRERHSAFNLTEGVLFNQAFVLAQGWPGGQNPPYPAKCLTNSGGQFCPTTASLKNNFTGADFSRNSDWVTRVRDNYGELAVAYVPEKADGALTGAKGTCAAPCSRDFNGDRQLWVQARATAQGQARSIVALMKLEQLQESMPQAAVAAGAMSISNSSSVNDRPLMDGTGSNIVVRCQPDPPRTGGSSTASCTNYRQGQMTPAPEQACNPSDSNVNCEARKQLPEPLMTADQIARFREKAKILGTYFTGCPPDDFRGEVVFVEACYPTTGVYQNGGATVDPPCNAPGGLKNTCTNRIDRPGLLIVQCGGLVMGGQWTYVGIVYLANNYHGQCPGGMRGNGTCDDKSFGANDVLEMRGGFGIWGVIAAEGPACVKFGSNGFQFKYDNAVYGALVSFGTVGLVQNTWRELRPVQGA